MYNIAIFVSFYRCYRSTDTVDHRRERSGEWLDVDHSKTKRIGDTAATSSRHRADFRPWRVRRLALRKRICRQRTAADQLTQEASIGTQLRASFTTAMRLERCRRRSCMYARTHAARPSRRRQTHNDAFLATRRAMPIKRKSDVDRKSKKSYLSLGSHLLSFINLFTTNTSFNEITAQNFTSRLLVRHIYYLLFYIYLFLYS